MRLIDKTNRKIGTNAKWVLGIIAFMLLCEGIATHNSKTF